MNGTDLTPFGAMNSSQRKQLMNKAIGVDKYDKINRLATDDYRYTNKLITSLNNTKEFLLQSYGSYENLQSLLNESKQQQHLLSKEKKEVKSQIDSIMGKLSMLERNEMERDLLETNQRVMLYEKNIGLMGNSDRIYDELVNDQLRLTRDISSLQGQRESLFKDMHRIRENREELLSKKTKHDQYNADYQNQVSLKKDIEEKISSMVIHHDLGCSVDYLKSIITTAQTINSICKEIVSGLNKNHIQLFYDFIERGIDISAFLVHEGNVLMDGEKERSIVARFQHMLDRVDGKECTCDECIDRRKVEVLENYFQSYRSTSEHEFTSYDIEQMDMAYKNLMTVKRLVGVDVPNLIKPEFDLMNILKNLVHGVQGINMSTLNGYLEDAIRLQQRDAFYIQLKGLEDKIKTMEQVDALNFSSGDIDQMNIQLSSYQTQVDSITQQEQATIKLLDEKEQTKAIVGQFRHINIKEEQKKQKKLEKQLNQYDVFQAQLNVLNGSYIDIGNKLYTVDNQLKVLEDAHAQYINTINEIEKYASQDYKSKIIAEATSPTKGRPILIVKQKLMDALSLTNRLLDIMWGGSTEILEPEINTLQFNIPFRVKDSISNDIRYGSQSEKALLFTALNLSISSLLTKYNIPLLDEIDGFLDDNKRDSYIEMITEVMMVLNIDQLFMISHNTKPEQYDSLIHTIDLSAEVYLLKTNGDNEGL
jgi:DNA repair exonuclease SbcCD ATPase subunit